MATSTSTGSSSSSRQDGLERVESVLRSHLELSTISGFTFAELVSSVTETWAAIGHDVELESAEGVVKDAVKDILLRVIRDDALETAETEVETALDRLDALYMAIKLKLDYALAFCQIGKLEDKTPFVILEDVFAYLTVPGCEHVFSFLETRSKELKLPLPVSLERTTGLALLRACNVLLARLSKSQDSVFCGRILSFMASAFGLGARSGVNLRGDFNVGNETLFEQVEEEDNTIEEEDEVAPKEELEVADVEMEAPKEEDEKPPAEDEEEEEEGAVKDEIEDGETNEDAVPDPAAAKKDVVPVKAAEVKPNEVPSPASTEPFYKTFWTLQSYFANPALLSNPSTPDATTPHTPFGDFQVRAGRVMDTLAEETEKEKVLRGTGGDKEKDKEKDAPKKKEEKVLTGLDEVFMPKFLTSPGLLAFELADVSFRRQIMVQYLILLQHLRALYVPGGPGKITKSKMPNVEATKDKEKWLESTWERAVKELRATYPEGGKFTDTVLALLRREENWTRWKDLACPAFDLPPISDSSLRDTRAKRARLEAAPPPPLQFSVGTPALTKLWENHNFEDISQLKVRRPAEELHDYSKRLARTDLLASQRKRALEKAGESIETDDQLSQIEDRKSSLTFRALRQASRPSSSSPTSSGLTLFPQIKPGTNRANYVSILLEAEKLAARKEKEEAEERERATAAAAAKVEEGGEVGGGEMETTAVPVGESEGGGAGTERDREGGAVMKEERVEVAAVEKVEEGKSEEGEPEVGKVEGDGEAKMDAEEPTPVPSPLPTTTEAADTPAKEGDVEMTT